MISSYPSIYNFGHKAIEALKGIPVYVEEKVDGSQFSFMKDEDGVVRFRSKGQELFYDPDSGLCNQGMFTLGCKAVWEVRDKLLPAAVYRGELLSKPKHNVLRYTRTPNGNVAIFDIQENEMGGFLDPKQKMEEADKLGFESVPFFEKIVLTSADQLKKYLELTSFLGGALVEGAVVKPVGYNLYGQDKKVLMGKYVSEAFKETHRKEWGEGQEKRSGLIEELIKEFRTPARWAKAVQHLKEQGLLNDDPRDIPLLLKEVNKDILKEHRGELEKRAFQFIWKEMSRGVVKGLPEWYKEKLLEKHFE